MIFKVDSVQELYNSTSFLPLLNGSKLIQQKEKDLTEVDISVDKQNKREKVKGINNSCNIIF